ncbi:MAG TPA: CHAT domain-containing tetratricopeptide repeat protein [Pyrinomonadaceae bacterium]|nr:CHAT domain-containing tetratricopeptide repeat protein [Pyrinomonadaceae bacterium]
MSKISVSILASVMFVLMGMTCTAEFVPSAQGTARPVSADPQDVRELAVGMPVERELTGGEVHVYRLDVMAGQYIHFTIDQRGIDVVVVLSGPDGVPVMEMDGHRSAHGVEELSWEGVSGGVYLLEVKARDRQANSGRYEVKMDKAPQATVEDRARIAAKRLFMEGKRAQQEGRGEGLEGAIKKYEQAVEKWRSVGDRKREALALTNLGIVNWNLSQYGIARDHLEQALVIWREVKDRYGEEATLNSLGGISQYLRQYEKAKDYLNQSLAIVREMKDKRAEGATLNKLGNVYRMLGEHEKGKDYYEQALAISREIKDRRGEGLTLSHLGSVYTGFIEYEKALYYHEQSLAISREIQDRSGEGLALNNLGFIYQRLSQYEKARDYYEQALAIRSEIKDRTGQGYTLHYLGVLCETLAQYEKARDYLEQALAIRREIKDRRREAATLDTLGSVYQKLGQNQTARYCFDQALVIGRTIGEKGDEASILLRLASFEGDRGNLSEARKQIESALVIIENVRATYLDQELRAAYFACARDSYEFYIGLLMRLHKQDPTAGHEAAALQASERVRARTLLDTLAEAGADIRQGADLQLVERERSLHQQLNIKAQQQMKLLAGPHTAEQAAASGREIESLTGEYQRLQAQIRRTSPRYAALTQPQPLSVKEIQQQVLDSDTLLLEYALGKERSYVWAVTPTSITSYELPKRSEIETAARRVYKLLTTSHKRESKRQSELTASELSRMVLRPVAEQLGKKRLLIVSEGALQYIPFGALPVPEMREPGLKVDVAMDGLPNRPLILEHEIVNAPSASTLAVLRRELAGRPVAPKTLAVLADPVFQSDDLRVKRAGITTKRESGQASTASTAEGPSKSDLTRSASESGLMTFERLRFTRQEADAIVAQAPERSSLKALDFVASRATLSNTDLDQYRIIHFATHGLLNSQHPELSGVVLSLVDEQGRPQDGFLRAHDIYNLKLRADLVVLSACRTALGEEIKGEGLAGLTRGFMYAGAERVVASLWDVEDEATAELMKRFYRGMLREGLRPAAALRAAQISMSKEPRWRAPSYWAGFMLQGEWR